MFNLVARAAVVSLMLCGLGGCSRHEPPPVTRAAAELPEISAAVMQLEPQLWPQLVRAQGSLIADEVAVVGAKVPGRVSEVHVDLGDKIDGDKPIVTLETDQFKLEIAQAEAELMQSRAAVGLAPDQSIDTLDPAQSPPVREQKATWDEAKARSERVRQLVQQNATTSIEVEQSLAAEKVAAARHASALNTVNQQLALIRVRQAAVDLAKQRLLDAEVKSPFSGVVQQRHVAQGSFVSVGQPLATIVRTNPLRFRGTLPERFAQKLTLGQEVQLSIQSASGKRSVKVTRISPALDPMSRALTFEASVDNADGALRAGLFGEADIVIDEQARALVVPQSAVIEFAGTEKVWQVVDGVAREVVVATGERRDGRIEILSGLSAGATLLLRATEGQVARVQPLSESLDTHLVPAPEQLADGKVPPTGPPARGPQPN